MTKLSKPLLILFCFIQTVAAQNCDGLYLGYDSLDEHNLINDAERKTKLNALAKQCPEYLVGYWQRYGLIYDRHMQDDSALYFYSKALDLIEYGEQHYFLNSVLVNIGNLYIRNNLNQKALDYYNMDTIQRLKDLDSIYLYEFYFNRADLYSKTKQFDLAFYNYNKAINYTDTAHNINERVNLRILETEIYKLQGDNQKAFQCISSTWPLRFHSIDPETKANIYHIYTYQYSHLKKDPNIRPYADTALILARSLNNDIVLSGTLKDMSEVFAILGDTARAYSLFSEWMLINTMLQKRNMMEGIKLSDFEIQNGFITKELKYQKAQSLALIIFIFLLLITSIILFLYLRQRQKINKQNLLINENELKRVLQEQDLYFLNAQLSGQIDERKRIATELHNSLGNRLASIKLGFEGVALGLNDFNAQSEKIKRLNQEIDEACSKLRTISHVQYAQAWLHELKISLGNITKTHSIKTTLIDNDIDLSGNRQMEMDIYTISEGLLSNSIKYSNATEITIQIYYLDGMLCYSYEDNGTGFSNSTIEMSDGLGYRILKERVAFHKGNWHLDSSPGKGMTLFIELPFTA